MKERNCVIVDAYSTGRYLPEQFKRYGIGTVHVMSAAQIPPIFQAHFDANLYDEVIRPSERMGYDDIVEYHLQALHGREFEFVIAGCEFWSRTRRFVVGAAGLTFKRHRSIGCSA